MTNTISHPLTKTMSISEAEKEISKCEDGEWILITYPENTTEAWESIDLSHGIRIVPDRIKAGISTELTKLIEESGISKSTPVTVTPTQIDLTINIKDPMILILADFKKMCNNILEDMLDTIQRAMRPKDKERAIRNAASRMYQDWERGGGYREAIAEARGLKSKNDIKCSLIGDTLKKLRVTADKKRDTPTIDDIEDFVRKVQKLTLKDITITALTRK